jgi:hypothetical protein
VLLLETIDHFLSVEDVLSTRCVGVGGMVVIGRSLGIQAAYISNLFERLEYPHVVTNLFDATIEPNCFLSVTILRARIVKDLHMSIHGLVDDFIRHVG